MCGIFGIVAGKREIKPGYLLEMSRLIRHRGPDDEGFAFFTTDEVLRCSGPDTPEAVSRSNTPFSPQRRLTAHDAANGARLALGHRRLSIVDLSPNGHQPMVRDGRYWIVYNGEIYNYIELRKELEQLGHVFVSASDTDVLVAAYAQWGISAFDRFNGMWSFALYDSVEHRLVLSRDRFGVKPLYYWTAPDGALWFASEIKAFSAHPDWRARVDGQRLYDYLVWGIQDHTENTMFAEVKQLPGGCCISLRIDPSDSPQPVLQRWYELNPLPAEGEYSQAVEQYRSLLEDAVRLRLRADVPIGSCLSGGLDSSSIVSLVNRQLMKGGNESAQHTFSAVFDNPKLDERPYINEVLSQSRVNAGYVAPDGNDLFNQLPALARFQDEPFTSSSVFAQWCVFSLARQSGVTVMLDGQGADELLAGYSSFYGPRLAGLFSNGNLPGLVREWQALHQVQGRSHKDLLMRLGGNLLPGLIAPLKGVNSSDSLNWLNVEKLGASPWDPYTRLGTRSIGIRGSSSAQVLHTNLPMLLHWEDRSSMACSIEARVPFLDYRLVEFTLSQPDDRKINDGVTKRILRDAMQGVIPEKIRTRITKLGFATPETEWLSKHPDKVNFWVQRAADRSGGVLNLEKIMASGALHDPRHSLSGISAWRLVSLGAWLDTFDVSIH